MLSGVSSITIDGHFVYRLPVGIFYAEPAGHPAYLFPLLGLTVPWGIWRLWRERNWGPLILLLGWGGPVYLFLAGIPYQNFRFGLTLYLPLVPLGRILGSVTCGISLPYGRSHRRRLFFPCSVC